MWETIVTGVFGDRVTIGQENGPEVEVAVFGDEHYARYETPEGYTVVYDPDRGLFTYALVRDGRFESSGIPMSQRPPPELERHAQESAAVRLARAAERSASSSQPGSP